MPGPESRYETRLFLIVGAAILALAFGLSVWDLDCAAALYDPGSAYGELVQHYGAIFAFPLYPLAILLLAWPAKRRGHPLLATASAALLAQAILHTEILTSFLKWLWGRPRYLQIQEGKAVFAGLFDWQVASGFVSFPSGHVATALVVLPIALVLWSAGRRRAGGIVFLCTLLYALAVAYGRMVSGAHFLSDVTASFGLAFLCAPLSVWLGRRYLRLF